MSDLVVEPSREATVGETTVRRALPRRGHRTVGAWCFADHFGPATGGGGIGPHPHIGLQTVTWLLEGELLHRDSLGSEQPIQPGQLNLMTAGWGIAHAEEGVDGARNHGIQLWVAQPAATRNDAPAFEHHGELPQAELDQGEATVLVGAFAGVTSTARADTDHVGAELLLAAGRTVVPLRSAHEHALIVLEGAVQVDGEAIVPGFLAHLDVGRDELALDVSESARVMLLGGTPFESAISMWWNFVAGDHDEITAAREAWQAGDEDRFGDVSSLLARIDAPGLPWG